MSATSSYSAIDPEVGLQISPTDISQYARLDQCQRYLRLRMHQRTSSDRFLREYGVAPQTIPPLLRQSGARFEAVISEHVPHEDLSVKRGTGDVTDNAYVVERARLLPSISVHIVTQPRLRVRVGTWLVRGDIDILRLERDDVGTLRALIVDTKASRATKVEHRLQVAFYREMLGQLFADEEVGIEDIQIGVLYRGPATLPDDLESLEARELTRQRAAAQERIGATSGFLEIVADPDIYRQSVRDLVLDPHSIAARVAGADFEAVPFHLTYKCDGCVFNQFCLKWSAEHNDLSLIPHLTAPEKSALGKRGITTTTAMAQLKEQTPGRRSILRVAPGEPGREQQVGQLAATWPLGSRLDELIHRAQSYRRSKGDAYEPVPNIPSKGHSSLAYSDEQQNPNLVRIFIDAQHDYLSDRIYLLGALIVANTAGDAGPVSERHIVRMSDGPPETLEDEQQLIEGWINETLNALGAMAHPDEHGERKAPVHLIFYNRYDQEVLLDALARHFRTIFATTPLYDFVTQTAAYDSPVVSFLDEELRERKNLPITCQSLHNVATYMRFNWEPYKQTFKRGVFDTSLSINDDGQTAWYTGRSRFNSQIPLEYAYAAWGRLLAENGAQRADVSPYQGASVNLLVGFQARRLDAMRAVATQFSGNKETEKTCFDLSVLEGFITKADTFAQALDEFTTVERHAAMAAWSRARMAPPERRVLAGDCFVVRYDDADQTPETRERMVENRHRLLLRQQYFVAHPDELEAVLTKEQKAATKIEQNGLEVSLRIETRGIDCDLEQLLALTGFGEGDRVVLEPRWSVDSRLPAAEQTPYTPTPKQLLWALRADILTVGQRVDRHGNVVGFVDLRLVSSFGDGWRGYAFGTMSAKNVPLIHGERYTIDPDPNDWYGRHQADLTSKLCEVVRSGPGTHTMYDRLVDEPSVAIKWPMAAWAGQRRFLAGLDELARRIPNLALEPGKREYIGDCGDEPFVLVQGPPGTGKSYTTAFAVLARMQGALAAGMEFRVFLSCKTHSATDVLLQKVADLQHDLADYRTQFPDVFTAYFDPRLLDVPLFRFRGKGQSPTPIRDVPDDKDREKGQPKAAKVILQPSWSIVGATPAAIRALVKDVSAKSLFGTTFCDCLVLDEASQMSLPESLLAALPLKPDGQVIVVGDHRQMPPIVKHDWSSERRRTFHEFTSYESLFLTLVAMQPRMIRFEESFRLHADIAEFLRREIYQQDGIDFHSHQLDVLATCTVPDDFVRAALAPEHSLIVIVHDECSSQMVNEFEVALMQPVLEALAGDVYGFDAQHGLGVVVPHRAQRALYRMRIPVVGDAVQTVEKFQGDERTTIIVSATESDPEYLAQASDFLLDPRRLNVALSRAKQKVILVASRSVFQILSTDEETFHNAQLWKNLLHHTCTTDLWHGNVNGVAVQIFGNATVPGCAPDTVALA